MLTLPCAVALAAACASAQPESASRPPDALVKFYEGRARLATAEIDWSRREYTAPAWRSEHTQYFTTRLSPRERVLYTRGDEEGVPARTNVGTPAKVPKGFFVSFEGPDAVFDRWDGEGDAEWLAKGVSLGTPDLRCLGALPWFAYQDVSDAFWKDPGEATAPRKYSEWTEGSLRVVKAERPDGALTWWIDPQRGWQATRITFAREGVVEKEARIAVSKIGEYWFPQSVMFFSAGYRDGTEPSDVVTVDRAVFNDPRQPHVLTPADIGVTPGMSIWLKDDGMRKVGTGAWDGTKIISVRVFPNMGGGAEMVARLLVKTAPGAAASQPSVPESEWEVYTRRFIDRYKLTNGQTGSALKTLRDCQEQAQSYIARHKAEFEKMDQDERALPQADAAGREARLATIRDARQKLRAPIDEIFEEQLKPRLEKLPTRKQRAAAEPEPPRSQAPRQ
jgi:hypothetical protein